VLAALGEAARDRLTPYASLQPEVDSFETYLESIVAWGTQAARMGFRAVKLEATFSGPYVHKGPRWSDDLEAYAELQRRSPVRIAAGEWLSTRFEFVDLIERGGLAVVQPDVGLVGGLTEIAARLRARGLIRAARRPARVEDEGISVAVAAQLAMVTPHMPFFESLPTELCESRLRKELTDASSDTRTGGSTSPVAPASASRSTAMRSRSSQRRRAASRTLTGPRINSVPVGVQFAGRAADETPPGSWDSQSSRTSNADELHASHRRGSPAAL
jgi:hypothetical protein